MAAISSGILRDANLMNLKEIAQSELRREVFGFIIPNEEIIQCFKQCGIRSCSQIEE